MASGRVRRRDLLEEISLLERRIRVMGEDGDCGYERARSLLYRRMVAERRQCIAKFL